MKIVGHNLPQENQHALKVLYPSLRIEQVMLVDTRRAFLWCVTFCVESSLTHHFMMEGNEEDRQAHVFSGSHLVMIVSLLNGSKHGPQPQQAIQLDFLQIGGVSFRLLTWAPNEHLWSYVGYAL